MSLRSKLFIGVALFAAPAFAAPPATVTRLDWQRATAQFNNAYAAHAPAADRREALSGMIDSAYAQYFGEQAPKGMQTLLAATESILPDRSEIDRQIDALQVQVLPIVSRRDRPGLLRVRIQPIFQPANTSPLDFKLVIRAAADPKQIVLTQPLHIDFASAESLTLPKPDAEPGKYRVELIDPSGHGHPVGDWFVTPKSLDAQRVNTGRLLTTTRPSDHTQWEAQTIIRSRNLLLSDNIDPNNPSAFLNDPLAYSQAIANETAEVMKGRDPYIGSIGDQWRGVPAGANVIPARLIVPQSVGKAPAPLLIVLPESTQDENDWLDRLPGRPLQKFAEESGAIVLVPRTISMLAARDALATTIASLDADYKLDHSRIWLLGHGVGAAAAVDLANTTPNTVTKLALLAGGEFGGIQSLPPTLQIVGKFDAQFDPQRADAAINYAKSQSLPVEQRVRECGHMLLVNDALPDALHWLGERAPETK